MIHHRLCDIGHRLGNSVPPVKSSFHLSSKITGDYYDTDSVFIHLSLLLWIAIASLIHLVLRSDSCPNTLTWSHSITWFSLVVWSVMADLFCCSSADLLLCLVNLDVSLASTSFLCSPTQTSDVRIVFFHFESNRIE